MSAELALWMFPALMVMIFMGFPVAFSLLAVAFVFAGGVTAHQPLQRAGFVTPVVVDVQVGETLSPLGHQVDERFEQGPLPFAVESPAVLVAPVPIHEAEQVLEPAVGGGPGTLDVEEKVPFGRLREGQQAASVLGRPDQFVKRQPPFASGELRLRLTVDAP